MYTPVDVLTTTPSDVAFSRGAAGIIIASICGFIVSIILLILLPLLLFQKQKKLNISAKRSRNFDATSHGTGVADARMIINVITIQNISS